MKLKTEPEVHKEEAQKKSYSEIKEEITTSNSRPRKLPSRFADYEMNFDEDEHLALSALSYADEVPESLEIAKTRSDYKYWKEAVDEEIKSLTKNNTWTIVERPKDSRLIDSKWVFRLKRDQDGQIKKYKARLVARGFMQKEGFDYEETYAPVARLTTLRTLLAIINHENLEVQQMDVKSAFLHGTIEEDIYMKIPEGFVVKDGLVCKLNKALYGLKQAPYRWNYRFNEFAERHQLKRSQHDPCLYVKTTESSVIYLLLYVDDIIIASNRIDEIKFLKQKLSQNFEMHDMGDLRQFLGINVRKTNDGIYLNQRKYLLNVLERFGMSDCKESKTPMEANIYFGENKETENTLLVKGKPVRELIGCLMYLMLCTRPDLSASLNLCSRAQSNPTEQLWISLKRILRYLKGTVDYELFYNKNSDIDLCWLCRL